MNGKITLVQPRSSANQAILARFGLPDEVVNDRSLSGGRKRGSDEGGEQRGTSRRKVFPRWIRQAIHLRRFDDDDGGPPPCPASATIPIGVPFGSADSVPSAWPAVDAMAA